jgi:hypothetical protein
MGIMILGLTLGTTCKKKNQPPGAPSIPSGPVSGRKGDTLRYSTMAEDPDGDSVSVRFDWGDSTRSAWSALVPSGDSVTMTHVWQKSGNYAVRTQARDARETTSGWSGVRSLTVSAMPMAPAIPAGPAGGRKGDTLRFWTMAEDPGRVSVSVRFDWGDSTMSDWSAFAPSGDTVVMTHAYQKLGTYLIKAQAKDAEETTSVWSAGYRLTLSSFRASFGGAGVEESYSVQQTTDSGYILVGRTSSYGAGGDDVWLVKTDASGNEVWDRTFGGTGGDEGYSVQQTSDGGYIVVGETESYGAGGRDVWLIKTDASGNRVWDKTFGGTGDDFGNSVQQTSSGGYIITGGTYSYGAGGWDVWLIKADASGNKVWDRTFGGPKNDFGNSVQQTSDGGYIITGSTMSYGAGDEDVWLIKTDSLGSRVWDKTFGGTGLDEGYSVQQTSDGGYIVTGSTESYGAGEDDVWLVKTDASGNELWDKTFGGQLDDEASSIEQTSDGGYIVTGLADSYNPGCGKAWLIKTDADGSEAWDRKFAEAVLEAGNCVRQTMDGGYVISGVTEDDWPGSPDFLLIKTDADGN